MAFLNKLFGKKEEPAKAKPAKAKPAAVKTAAVKPAAEAAAGKEKKAVGKIDGAVLVAPHLAEKALAAQKDGQYIFIVSKKANKIAIKDAVKKTYGVKVKAVNIVNIPKKAIRVGRTSGFKAGYKKAIVTLAKGQTIELAK